jgi:chromatin remodeling complex protein RSC6
MNKSEGTEIARTEVTRALVAYIKQNKLENEQNSQIIKPDNKLKFLLGLEDGQELTYFNIQKYMNKHFVKNIIEA